MLPSWSCVGAGGSRVKSIVRELNGEKIDVIKYSPDPKTLLEECIKPAVAKNVKVDVANRLISFEVSEKDLSVVIGKRGSNAKLTSRLLGWKLDIAKEVEAPVGVDEKVAQAADMLSASLDIDFNKAAILVQNGFVSPDAFEDVDVSDLVDMGFSAEDAEAIISAVKKYQSQ